MRGMREEVGLSLAWPEVREGPVGGVGAGSAAILHRETGNREKGNGEQGKGKRGNREKGNGKPGKGKRETGKSGSRAGGVAAGCGRVPCRWACPDPVGVSVGVARPGGRVPVRGRVPIRWACPCPWACPGHGGGSAVAGAALRPVLPLAHPDHGPDRPPAAAARRDPPAGPDRPVAAVCSCLQGPHDAAAPGVVQGLHLLRSLSPAAVLPHRRLRLPQGWLQVDQDSCHYLLHPRSHLSVCHPGPHPVPRLLQVGARGPSDAARAPRSALDIPALPADPPADPVHHALQPPLQTRGEEKKEVAHSGSRPHHSCPGFGSNPALTESSGTNIPSCWLQQLPPEHRLLQGKWNCFECTALLPPQTALPEAGPATPGALGRVCAGPLQQANGLVTLDV